MISVYKIEVCVCVWMNLNICVFLWNTWWRVHGTKNGMKKKIQQKSLYLFERHNNTKLVCLGDVIELCLDVCNMHKWIWSGTEYRNIYIYLYIFVLFTFYWQKKKRRCNGLSNNAHGSPLSLKCKINIIFFLSILFFFFLYWNIYNPSIFW